MAKLTRDQKFVVGFTLFSALGHLLYSFGWDTEILGINLGVWFVVNGIGYLAFLYLLYFAEQVQDKNLIRLILGGWAVGSILAWAIFHTKSAQYDTLLDYSLINKGAEVLLLIFLYFDYRAHLSNGNQSLKHPAQPNKI